MIATTPAMLHIGQCMEYGKDWHLSGFNTSTANIFFLHIHISKLPNYISLHCNNFFTASF